MEPIPSRESYTERIFSNALIQPFKHYGRENSEQNQIDFIVSIVFANEKWIFNKKNISSGISKLC